MSRSARAFQRGTLPMMTVSMTRNWSKANWSWRRTPNFLGRVMEAGAGTGGVYLLRWYWWRINAWSEISAMTVALACALYVNLAHPFGVAGVNAPEFIVFAKSTMFKIGRASCRE